MLHGILQPSMNVRLVKLDLVLLLSEMNPAGDDATDKTGQKNDNGIQHFIHPEKHSQPTPDMGEGLKPMAAGRSPKRFASLRGSPAMHGQVALEWETAPAVPRPDQTPRFFKSVAATPRFAIPEAGRINTFLPLFTYLARNGGANLPLQLAKVNS